MNKLLVLSLLQFFFQFCDTFTLNNSNVIITKIDVFHTYIILYKH